MILFIPKYFIKVDIMSKSKAYPIVLVGVFVAIISICAWISIPTVPIPITLQTLGIFFTASILGAKMGTVSIIIYILLGAVGLPIFSNFTGGLGILLSPTGGFIVGFIFTALLIGIITTYFKNNIVTNTLAMILGLLLCYTFGSVWYCFYAGVDFITAVLICVVPFLIGDTVKICISAILVTKLKKHIKI